MHINEIELATDLATIEVKNEFGEDDCYIEYNDEIRFTDEAQDFFNDKYDFYLGLIGQTAIKTPEPSAQVGTVAWVKPKLEKIKPTITQATDPSSGLPSLSYVYETEDGGEDVGIFAVVGVEAAQRLYQHRMDFRNYGDVHDRVYCLYPIETSQDFGMFNYLTPAALKLVEEFISDETYEWITNLEKQ